MNNQIKPCASFLSVCKIFNMFVVNVLKHSMEFCALRNIFIMIDVNSQIFNLVIQLGCKLVRSADFFQR